MRILVIVVLLIVGAVLMWLWIRGWTKLYAEGLTDLPPPGISLAIRAAERRPADD
ncbi:MAG TPA: hypothetical protein VGH54_21535 [Mycobacterium sp.]|jgi:hypothetical protein|uniref:hypothetical protein n=1 Tax=Mycobacterium sp. TaxID=1785 RepID=UPI002F3E3613